jgi:hypothetical protein
MYLRLYVRNVHVNAGFRIRIILARIRIKIFTLMRIRIQLFTSIRIRILLFMKLMRICDQ